MIVEVIVLTGILGVGFRNLKQQREKYRKYLLAKQREKSAQLQKIRSGESVDISSCARPTRSMARTPKDMAVLAVAVGVSSVGTLIYRPLIFLAPPLVLYASRKRIFSAWALMKEGKVGVETLATIAVTGAMIKRHFLIGSLLGLTSAFGDYLSSRVIKDSQHQLLDVFRDIPGDVWLLKDGVEVSTPLAEVQIGDVVVVSAGQVIPADGTIVSGMAGIDEHRFTGESIPAEKGEGDEVFAMTLVLSGKIHFVIERTGKSSVAMQIADILNHTADYKSSTVLEAQALSQQLVKPALLSSVIVWPIFGFSAAVSMLIAHPKERLQISAPISMMNYLRKAMDEGVLIKDGRSLELLYKVDTVVFDKTGTLTEDVLHIGAIHTFLDYEDVEVLAYAAVAEYKQKHPLAQAILAEAENRGIAVGIPDSSKYHLGYGIEVIYQGKTIRVGSSRYMKSEGIVLSKKMQLIQNSCSLLGHGLIMVSCNEQLIGAIELLPTIRAEAKSAIQALRQSKKIKKIYIVSGDHEVPTRKLAEELGIDQYFAHALPQQKADIIEQLQEEGCFVCFVGDGINDAIAMKQAQVSISLYGASQLATDTAQILLLDKGIAHLPNLFSLAYGFNYHMRNQYAMIIGPSILGVTMVILSGWGIGSNMILNMLGLTATLSYSILDKPKQRIVGSGNSVQVLSGIQSDEFKGEQSVEVEATTMDAERRYHDTPSAAYRFIRH